MIVKFYQKYHKSVERLLWFLGLKLFTNAQLHVFHSTDPRDHNLLLLTDKILFSFTLAKIEILNLVKKTYFRKLLFKQQSKTRILAFYLPSIQITKFDRKSLTANYNVRSREALWMEM